MIEITTGFALGLGVWLSSYVLNRAWLAFKFLIS